RGQLPANFIEAARCVQVIAGVQHAGHSLHIGHDQYAHVSSAPPTCVGPGTTRRDYTASGAARGARRARSPGGGTTRLAPVRTDTSPPVQKRIAGELAPR